MRDDGEFRERRVRRGGVRQLTRVAALALATGCSISGNVDVDNPPYAFRGDSSPIQIVTTQVGGKNVFIPSTVVLTGGRAHELSVFNTTESAHGFRIPELGIEEILAPGQETLVSLPALEGGHVYRIDCHLHPPHRTATLVVLPGD